MCDKMTLKEIVVVLKKLGSLPIRGGEWHSYRGYYDQLALHPSRENITCKDLAKQIENIVKSKQVFHGYKGGEYTYNWDTNLYVAFRGNSGEYVYCIGVDASGASFITKEEEW